MSNRNHIPAEQLVHDSDLGLPLAELARVTGYGRARLFQILKQSIGMTPNDYSSGSA